MNFKDITLSDVSVETKVETLGVVLDKKLQELHDIVSTVETIKGDKGDQGKQGVAGKDGKDGKDGRDGINGRDGKDGKDGKDGVDAPYIVNAEIALDDTLLLTLSDGKEIKTNAPIVSKVDKPTFVSSTRVVTDDAPNYAVRYDEISSSLSYRGEAVSGSIETDTVWRIQKIEIISNDVSIKWANGNTSFTNAWTNRLSLNYS